MQVNRRQAIRNSAVTFAGLMALKNAAFAQQIEAKITLETLAGKKILFFTKSAGFEHSVVKRENGAPAFAERMMANFAKKYSFEVEITKDGTIFDDGYADFDSFCFYTTLDLTNPNIDSKQGPPMTAKGKENLLAAIAGGKGFVGSHCAADTFHSKGEKWENQSEPDPYIQMIGGEFSGHGKQQATTMKVIDSNFPGADIVGDSFSMTEEWYSLKNFAPDMHVILLQETKSMEDFDYQRPAYPATWAKPYQNGRVFYTSMGHREDVWTNPIFESFFIGGLAWASGAVDCKIPPNLKEVAPEAATLPKK